MGSAAQKLKSWPLTMRALCWDGHELRFEPARPMAAWSSGGEDRKSKSAEATNSGSEFGARSAALVKVHLAGICSTDLQIFSGYMGFTGIPGHEFVGSVENGPAELVGKRVVGEINFACGQCEACRRELGRHCPNRKVMGILNADGAFAEFLVLPSENLHLVPPNISDEEAVFTEPLAAAFEILTQVELNPGDDVLVLGDGKLGNLCAQVLRLTGAKISCLGKHAEKLALLKKLGIRTRELHEWEPRLFDVVVEATGSTSGLEIALGAVRPRGTLVLKSTLAARHEISLAPLVINEVKLIGSRCGPFPEALAALASRQISVRPLTEKIYSLDDGIAAVAHARKRGARKILLRT